MIGFDQSRQGNSFSKSSVLILSKTHKTFLFTLANSISCRSSTLDPENGSKNIRYKHRVFLHGGLFILTFPRKDQVSMTLRIRFQTPSLWRTFSKTFGFGDKHLRFRTHKKYAFSNENVLVVAEPKPP